jgi:hypothetical protein
MIVLDPEVKIDEPVDLSNAPPYISKALADGKPGWSVTRSNIDQMNAIMKIMDEDLRAGALGVGIGLAYMAIGATSYEVFEAQRTAACYGRLASVHTRYHLSAQTPTEAPIAFDEVFTNAMLLGAPLLMAHDNDYGGATWALRCWLIATLLHDRGNLRVEPVVRPPGFDYRHKNCCTEIVMSMALPNRSSEIWVANSRSSACLGPTSALFRSLTMPDRNSEMSRLLSKCTRGAL